MNSVKQGRGFGARQMEEPELAISPQGRQLYRVVNRWFKQDLANQTLSLWSIRIPTKCRGESSSDEFLFAIHSFVLPIEEGSIGR